jgi:O-antigen/teichoic acid export membrane protein
MQFKLHAMMSGCLAALTILVGWVVTWSGSESLRNTFVGAGLALPFMLFLWYVRRVFYVLRQPRHAFLVSASYFFLLILAVTTLRSLGFLNSFTCFIALGITSLIGTFVATQKGIDLLHKANNASFSWIDFAKEQWLYGRWIAAATILSFSANQIQVILLAGLINLQAAGALDALQNFIAPVSQGIVAISTLVLPLVSYDFGQLNIAQLRRKITIVISILMLIAASYEFALVLFPKQLEFLLYNGKYTNFSYLIPILGVVPIFAAVTAGYALALRAIQKPQFYLFYGAIVAPVGLITGILFTNYWGLAGASLSLVVTSLVTLLVHIYLYRTWFLKSTNVIKVDYE